MVIKRAANYRAMVVIISIGVSLAASDAARWKRGNRMRTLTSPPRYLVGSCDAQATG